ncbi:AraC family transcriptional regulator [Chitinophaga vietnamensis]|uniref:AraC family transcriptional regulator n=1 Tax=Chitinophaga vietnamensis TaxID=2593957 RepID=UPI001375E171|nr:helix-turn-helix domain-containing protein [Chitinophaga vietnamensis]
MQRQLIVDREIKDSFQVSRLSNTSMGTTALVSVAYHRIFILSEAKGTIQIDQEDHPVNGREVFLVAKGQVFAFTADTRLNGFEIIFGDCFWEKTPTSASNCKAALFNHTALHQRLPLLENDAASLLPVCELLLQEYANADYPNQLDAMAAFLKIIMIKLANILAASGCELNDFDNRLYQQFLELISTRFRDTREVSDFAKMLAVSTRKLSDVCKQKSGYGAKEIINTYLIAEAKRSLQFSTKPIKQIAYDLAFATPEQFSHFFKKITHASPADYRHIFVNIGR